jgi:PAS domain S-box-containing protein
MRRGGNRVKIRGRLAWMVLAALMPMLIAVVVGAALLLQNERHAIERDALGRTRSAMSAIDGEVRNALDTLKAIASSNALDKGDTAAFLEDAILAQKSQPNWTDLALSSASGELIFNTYSPLNAASSTVVRRLINNDHAILENGKVAIGNIAFDAITNRPAIHLHLPIEQSGKVRYILTATIDPVAFLAILQAQRLPADWIIALADRNLHFIARIPQRPVGAPISDTFREGLRKATEGFIEGRTVEGLQSYTPYVQSQLTGWALGIAIPRTTVNAGAWKLLPPIVLGVFLSMALAIGIGRFMGQRIAEPVAALADSAAAIQRGETPLRRTTSRIEELNELDLGLRAAAAAVVAREADAKAAQEAMRSSEQKYRTLVANLPGTAVFLVNRDLRYQMAEGEALATAGLRSSELVGKTLHQALPTEAAMELEPLYRQALEGETFSLEHVIFGRYYLTRAAPVRSEDDRIEAVLAVSHDITERRQASDIIALQQAELRTMLGIMPVGVAITHDAKADTVSITARLAELMGVEPGDYRSLTGAEAGGAPCRWFSKGRPILPADLPIRRAAHDAVEVRNEEFDIERADGVTVSVIASAAPLYDENGKVRGAIAAHIDVTALKRIQRQLEAADRRKDKFLATLAHELRNPMAPIRYAVAMLRPDAAPEAVEQARQTIERQSAVMARLIDDLMDISRITRDAIELKLQRVDLRQLAREAVEIAQPLIDSMRHRVDIVLPSRPLWVSADATRLLQVFGNLLMNAAKYSDPGTAVEMTLREVDGSAVAEVRDSGIGLSSGMLTAVFELFSQVHKERRTPSGLGVGLSIAKRLVEMHGGSIWASSEGLGRGATFTFKLPLVAVDTAEDESEQEESATRAPAGTRVLVVDDNADTAETLALMLTAQGLAARTAQDGRSALAVAEEFRPDVAVLDLGLPDISGDEVARILRRQPWGKTMVLIAVTGWGQPRDRQRTAAAGLDVHLVKPVDPNELVHHISRRRRG